MRLTHEASNAVTSADGHRSQHEVVILVSRVRRLAHDLACWQVKHPRVDLGRVGDHLGRNHLQRGQRLAEEPAGSVGIPADRHQHVDDLAVLVDRAVDVSPDAVDLDLGLIHEPPVTG
jgi:hypothetical protein